MKSKVAHSNSKLNFMKTEIEVLQPGLFSTIQDSGRFGFQKYGVPQSGVMDRYAGKLCNLILGNKEDSAVLEITMQGPQLKFNSSTRVCISGADLSVSLNGNPVNRNQVVEISRGDILKFGKRKSGFRAYIGISGGFNTEKIMGSRSWYEGLTTNLRLLKGMKIDYDPQDLNHKRTNSTVKTDEAYFYQNEIDVFAGPEFSFLSKEKEMILFKSEFTIAENSNRMAIQLKEPFVNDLEPIITGPVLPGSVQLTPSGNIIILARDCQTTGGYPRILQLSEKGLQVLSQKLPGEKITFRKVEF